MRVHQELIAERLTEWATDAVLEVTAADADGAARIAEEALGVVRFFMRRHVKVNVEIHKIGLVGEISSGVRPATANGWPFRAVSTAGMVATRTSCPTATKK